MLKSADNGVLWVGQVYYIQDLNFAKHANQDKGNLTELVGSKVKVIRRNI